MISIYLLVEVHALSSIQDTLDSLLENSTSAQSIVVVGTVLNEEEIRRVVGGAAPSAITVELAFTEEADHLSSAIDMAAKSGGMPGALFVKSGVTVSYAWDARLERIAQHNPKIGTVSPLCDSFEMFALLGDGECSKIAPSDVQYIDSLTFSLSSRIYIEVPCFLEDCFYLSPGALNLLAKHAGEVRSGDAPPCWVLGQLLSAHGHLNVLGDCLYVHSRSQVESRNSKYLLAQHSVLSVIKAAQYKRMGYEVLQCYTENISFKNLPGLDSRPVQLHVQHSLGGGLDKWVRDYSFADKSRVNLILKSSGRKGAFGGTLMLFSDVDDTHPLQTWEFAMPIQATAVSHAGYAEAVDEIIHRYSVDIILVSSLIGHSLDILETSKSTILIAHDYYPYCPALNVTFDSLCIACEYPRLAQCFKQNVHNRYFKNISAADWVALRERYFSMFQAGNLRMVIPSQSVKENIQKLEPRFCTVAFVTIPHGVSPMRSVRGIFIPDKASDGRLRILVLGRLTPDKGLNILKELVPELTSIADLYLVGSGGAAKFNEYKNIMKIIDTYKLDELPGIIHDINPDIALLLSVVPETYSFTLSELTELRVPVVASNLGSFADRIENNKTGFLVLPKAKDFIDKIRTLDSNRASINEVRLNLAKIKTKAVIEMVADYHRILPMGDLQIARFPINSYPIALNFMITEQRQKELLQKEEELSQMLTSRSWLLTKPLRWFHTVIERWKG